MQLSSVGPKTSNQSSGTQQSGMDMNTFLNLLSVQLATQNPLEPMNDRDFFAQMAQLGQVQGIESLNRQMTSLASSLSDSVDTLSLMIGGLNGSINFMQASAMVGKTVTADRPNKKDGESATVTGEVKRAFLKDGKLMLEIYDETAGKSYEVGLDHLQSVEG